MRRSRGISAELSRPISKQDLAAVDEFNRKASGAVIDTIEVRVCNLDEIELVRKHQPAGTTVFFEISPERADELLQFCGTFGGCAKLRTGGVVAEAFPALETVAGFLGALREAGCAVQGYRRAASSAALHAPVYLRTGFARGNDARISEPLYCLRNCLECAALGQKRCRTSRLPLVLPTGSAQTGTSAMTH